MAQVIASVADPSSRVDTGPQCLLPRLHLGLCLRVGEACAALLAEALAARVACMEDRVGECVVVPPLDAGAMAGTPSALLASITSANHNNNRNRKV